MRKCGPVAFANCNEIRRTFVGTQPIPMYFSKSFGLQSFNRYFMQSVHRTERTQSATEAAATADQTHTAHTTHTPETKQHGILCMFIASHRNIIASISIVFFYFDIFIYSFAFCIRFLCPFECQQATLYHFHFFSTAISAIALERTIVECRQFCSTYFGQCAKCAFFFLFSSQKRESLCWKFGNAFFIMQFSAYDFRILHTFAGHLDLVILYLYISVESRTNLR